MLEFEENPKQKINEWSIWTKFCWERYEKSMNWPKPWLDSSWRWACVRMKYEQDWPDWLLVQNVYKQSQQHLATHWEVVNLKYKLDLPVLIACQCKMLASYLNFDKSGMILCQHVFHKMTRFFTKRLTRMKLCWDVFGKMTGVWAKRALPTSLMFSTLCRHLKMHLKMHIFFPFCLKD